MTPTSKKLAEFVERKAEEVNGSHNPGLLASYVVGANLLSPLLLEAVELLSKCCAPEPDGFGNFVADEFTQQEVLDGRIFLTKISEALK